MRKLIPLMFLVLISLVFVSAEPLTPHGFNGQVTYSAGGNVDGVVIAKIDGVEVGRKTIVGGVYDLIIESEGNKTISFYVEGNSNSLATRQFSSFEITELNLVVNNGVAPATPPSSGGGGGGGGSSGSSSSSTTTTTPTITQTTGVIHAVSETQVVDGVSRDMSSGDEMKFSISGEQHSLNLEAINGNFARITVQSEPITFVLEVGKEKKIDFELDGVYDLSVKFNEIVDGKAKIKVQSINEEVPTTTNDDGESAGITGNVTGFAKSKVGITLIIGLVIVVAGIGVIVFRKKGKI